MNLFLFNNDNLDEVVFEDRNKLYGAYVLRKSYQSNLLKAVVSSLGVMLLFVSVLYAISLLRKQLQPFSDPIHNTPVETILKNIEIIIDPPKPQRAAASAFRNSNSQVFEIEKHATISIPPTIISNPDLPNNPLGDENGIIGGQIGVSTNGSETIETINSSPTVETTFETTVTEMPSFPGGVEAMTAFISKHINYPSLARESGVEGKVVISFVILTDGSIGFLIIEKGIGFGCDDEALRVIQLMPNWNVGKQNGRIKAVKLILPIVFKLQ